MEQKDNLSVGALIVLATLFAMPIVLVWLVTSQLSGHSFLWRRVPLRKSIGTLALLASTAPIIFAIQNLCESMISLNPKSILFALCILWVSELPVALFAGAIRLQHLATLLSQGRLAPNKTEATRRAIQEAAIHDAQILYSKLDEVLPLQGKSNNPIIGVIAQAPDHRLFITRLREPERDVLRTIDEDGLLTFSLSSSSPSHHLVIGATGSGKSTLLSRMAFAALTQGFRVAIIDMKGGAEEVEMFLQLGTRLDHSIKTKSWPGSPLDLWRGTASEIADRVMGFLPAPTQGGTEYYRARLARAIKSVTERTSASPPRSADELLNRIRNIGAFADDPEDRDALMAKTGGKSASSEIAEALGGYLEPLRMQGDKGTSGGWSWSDDWDFAVISLDATKESMKRLGVAILHDFDSWTRSNAREIDPRPMMLILDEGGVLQSVNGAPSLTNLVSRARSARVSVVIAAQTLTSLGPDGEEILSTGTTRWLGRTPDPEIMSMAAGTRSAIETGHQDGVFGFTGVRSLREQRALIVDPDLIRRLPTFTWMISEHGKAILGYCPPFEFRK